MPVEENILSGNAPLHAGGDGLDPRERWPLPTNGCRLLLVRHGQTVANAGGVFQGQTEWPLSELGWEQASLTGQALARTTLSAIYSSPLRRAFETAGAIAKGQGWQLAHVTPVYGLMEIDVGKLSGLKWDDLRTAHPEALAAFEAAEARQPHPRNRELLPGWEPIPQIVGRIWETVATLATPHENDTIAIVAHGGVFNAFLTHLLAGDARETPWRHPVPNCSITEVILEAAPRVARLHDTAHLSS